MLQDVTWHLLSNQSDLCKGSEVTLPTYTKI